MPQLKINQQKKVTEPLNLDTAEDARATCGHDLQVWSRFTLNDLRHSCWCNRTEMVFPKGIQYIHNMMCVCVCERDAVFVIEIPATICMKAE